MSSTKQKTDQVEDQAKVKQRRQRKHRVVVAALSVWNGKETESNSESNQTCVNPGPPVLYALQVGRKTMHTVVLFYIHLIHFEEDASNF